MAEALDLLPENLASWFQTMNVQESALLIDCRPFLAYNSGHISSAHNIHCPPIVKRRSGGSLPMENILRCPATRSQLLNGHFKYVVVYDEDTHYLQHLTEDSNMYLVLRSLNDELNSPVYFIKGGYELFQSVCPFLCVSHSSTESDSSESTGVVEWTTPGSHPTEDNFSILSDGPIRDTVKYRPSQDQGDPEAILPWLFLGSAYHAMQEPSLVSVGINALLNMASKSDTLTPAPKFLHKRMAVDDSCTSDISSWFPEAIDFIESVRKEGGKVLVHCHAGISRSATVCIAYIMWYKHWTMERAYDYLKSKRSLIAPNLNFMRQLLEFENQLEQNGRGGRLSSTSTSTRSSTSSYMSAMSTCCECDTLATTGTTDSNCIVKLCQYCSSNLSSPQQFDFDVASIAAAAAAATNNNKSGANSMMSSPSSSLHHSFMNTGRRTPSSLFISQSTANTGSSFTCSSQNNLLQGISSSDLHHNYHHHYHHQQQHRNTTTSSINKPNALDLAFENNLSSSSNNAISFIPQPPRSASANLFAGRSTSPDGEIASSSQHGGSGGVLDSSVLPPRPVSAKPMFNLPLTPCTHQANVFSFDSPICSPLSQHTNSPTLCHSPLVSPS